MTLGHRASAVLRLVTQIQGVHLLLLPYLLCQADAPVVPFAVVQLRAPEAILTIALCSWKTTKVQMGCCEGLPGQVGS